MTGDEWVVLRVRDRTHGSTEWRQERTSRHEEIDRYDTEAEAVEEARRLDDGAAEPGVRHFVRLASEHDGGTVIDP